MRTKQNLITNVLIVILLLLLFFSLPPQAKAQDISLELEVVQYPHLIFNGDRLPVTVSLSNVSGNQLSNVMLRSSTGEKKTIGTLQTAGSQESTLFLENYRMGMNSVEIYATYYNGESPRRTIWFEVRPPSESITLRIINAPQSIYEGTPFNAQLQVQNLWQQSVSGVRVKNGTETLYYVGALNANQSLDINLRIDKYETGLNRLQLVAEHERGSAAPLPLEFDVIPADSAVKVYLSSLSPANYPAETLNLSLVVAASEQAGISELEIKALTKGMQPSGYYLGEQIAEEQQVQAVDIASLLTGGSQTEEEQEVDRSVRGRELVFEAYDPPIGTQKLSFQISYRLGSSVIQKEFSVDTSIIESPSIRLIQAERIEANKGEETLVMLHVANDLPVSVEAVSVVPVGDIDTSPSEFFIGTMSPNDFLPASFRVQTDQFSDGDRISFKLVYRIGRQTYETSPISVVIHSNSTGKANLIVYIVPPVVVVLLVLIWLTLRRRKHGPGNAIKNGG
jgi:hypothetical protein